MRQRRIAGIKSWYNEFREHLKKHCDRFARLQPLCRLEDYLTKEFAAVVLEKSQGIVKPRFNVGKRKDGRRIDLAFTRGNLSTVQNKHEYKSQRETIYGFVELKYISYGKDYSNATDDIEPTLNSLHKQLGQFSHTKKLYAKHPVKLHSSKREIYGIVFASHVHQINNSKQISVESLVDKIEKKAKINFLSFNSKRPNLKPVYKDVSVCLLGAEHEVSLYAGLWRQK